VLLAQGQGAMEVVRRGGRLVLHQEQVPKIVLRSNKGGDVAVDGVEHVSPLGGPQRAREVAERLVRGGQAIVEPSSQAEANGLLADRQSHFEEPGRVVPVEAAHVDGAEVEHHGGAKGRKANTARDYRVAIGHIKRYLNDVPLQTLTREQVRVFYSTLLKTGKLPRHEGGVPVQWHQRRWPTSTFACMLRWRTRSRTLRPFAAPTLPMTPSATAESPPTRASVLGPR